MKESANQPVLVLDPNWSVSSVYLFFSFLSTCLSLSLKISLKGFRPNNKRIQPHSYKISAQSLPNKRNLHVLSKEKMKYMLDTCSLMWQDLSGIGGSIGGDAGSLPDRKPWITFSVKLKPLDRSTFPIRRLIFSDSSLIASVKRSEKL